MYKMGLDYCNCAICDKITYEDHGGHCGQGGCEIFICNSCSKKNGYAKKYGTKCGCGYCEEDFVCSSTISLSTCRCKVLKACPHCDEESLKEKIERNILKLKILLFEKGFEKPVDIDSLRIIAEEYIHKL